MLRKISVVFIIMCVVFANSSFFSFAVSANPTPFEVSQPSGEKFMASYFGDEFVGGVKAETGEVIRKGSDSYWYYIEIIGGEIITMAKYKIDPKPLFIVDAGTYESFFNNKPSISVSLPGQIGKSIIDQSTKKVTCLMPPGCDLTSVKPVIRVNAARYYAFGTIVGDEYGEVKDFSNPVEYVVKFNNYGPGEEIVEKWTVECVTWSAHYKPFEVSLPGQLGSSVVNMKNNTIKLYFKPDANLKDLEPSIRSASYCPGLYFSMVALNGQTTQDFSQQVQYSVAIRNFSGEIIYSDIWTVVCSRITSVIPETGIIKGTVSHAGGIGLYNADTGEPIAVTGGSSNVGGSFIGVEYDFILTNIPAGRYKLLYSSLAGSYVKSEWYSNAASIDKASIIEVKPGQINDNIAINADISPAVIPSEDNYAFTVGSVGQQSESQRFTLSFGRTYFVTVESIRIEGENIEDFIIVNDQATGKTGIGSNNSEIYFDVAFKPSTEGLKNAKIIITTNNEFGGTATISLKGQVQRIDPSYNRKIIIGDVTWDGSVDSTDYTMLKRWILKAVHFFPSPKFLVLWGLTSDVDGSGSIDSTDLTYLKRHVLKIIDEFPVKDIEYIVGDVDGDKVYSIDDVNMLDGYLSGAIEHLPTANWLAADINEDYEVDSTDLELLKERVSGI